MRRIDSILESPILPYRPSGVEMSAFILAAVKYLLDVQALTTNEKLAGAGAAVVRRQELIDFTREQALLSNDRLNSPLFERCLLELLASKALLPTPQGVRLP